MMRVPCLLLAATVLLAAAVPRVAADDESKAPDAAGKYTLRYKFHPGQTLRWKVTHQATVRTTVSGTTQTAESVSISVKVWRVTDVEPDGTATFVHQVDSVDMRHKLTGRSEVRYNSQTDEEPPVGFQSVAKSIGVPLVVVTMDTRGKILKRERKVIQPGQRDDDPMTIPLPEEAVPVGQVWSEVYDINVPLEGGGVKPVRTRQSFKLASVKNGVATIEAATDVLTPNLPPAVEAKLAQQETSGTVRLDVDAGCILGQQMDVDKRVIGFRGEASSLHYLTRFTEKLLSEEPVTASRPEKTGTDTAKE
jgi:hypothetical protein